MTLKMQFSNICEACGRTRHKKDIKYDPNTLQSYCANMMECNDYHPNSYVSVAERDGKLIDLINFKEASDEYFTRSLNSDDPLVKKAARLLEIPTSLRITDEDLAMYLVALQDERELSSMTKAVVEIIREHKEHFGKPVKESKPEPESVTLPEPVPSKPEPEPEPPVVYGTPAPVFAPTQVTQDEDDDMTF